MNFMLIPVCTFYISSCLKAASFCLFKVPLQFAVFIRHRWHLMMISAHFFSEKLPEMSIIPEYILSGQKHFRFASIDLGQTATVNVLQNLPALQYD